MGKTGLNLNRKWWNFGGKFVGWQVLHRARAEGGEELLFVCHHPVCDELGEMSNPCSVFSPV